MIHSFLLIGQSNMAGRGFLNEAVPVDSEHIRILRNGRWQPMFRPINPDRSFSGVNLAERFAELYARKYGVDVGLICCADGGTSLEQWAPGGILFDHAVMQAKLAQRTSVLSGILWHQGEADCSPLLHPLYRERFVRIMDEMRKALGMPEIPFVLGGLGDFLKDCPLSANLVYFPCVNKALQEIATCCSNVAFASAGGLGANPDNLHFSAAALYEFGERYFSAYERIAPGPSAETDSSPCFNPGLSEMEKL